MAKYISGFFCFVLPAFILKNWLLRLFGWKIGRNVKIGHSIILSKNVFLESGSRVGNLNFCIVDYLKINSSGSLGHLNYIRGPLYFFLGFKAALGNFNHVKRSYKPVTWGKSMLKVGAYSKITSGHTIDCTRPVILGCSSVIAGKSSQLWTHGYMHDSKSGKRVRIDGSIRIGDHVYIGSMSLINPGIKLCSGVTIGSMSVVSKSIFQGGFYASPPLRHLQLSYQEAFKKYKQAPCSIETVLNKKDN